MLVAFGFWLLVTFFAAVPFGGSVALWNAQGTLSEHGATVAVSAQGPDHVYTNDRLSFWVDVEVLLLNQSEPFNAVAVNVTEIRLEETDAATSHRWTPQESLSLTEGASWNETFKGRLILYTGGEEYTVQVEVQLVVVWYVLTGSGSSHRTEYWSSPFRYDFHYKVRPTAIIPGFPWSAILLTILITFGVVVSQRHMKSQKTASVRQHY